MATKDIMPLIEEIFKNYADVKDGDFLRETIALILNKLMDAQVSAKIGAERHQRTDNRNNYRNGTRIRPYETRLGSIDLNIPKLRQGTYFPSFLEPRRMWEQALINVIQEAYVHGISTRKVDEIVQAMGMEGMPQNLLKSENITAV